MAPDIPNDLILFHYPFSPFARRLVWYLTLRGIPYAECIQPHILPRPDLQRLGIHYRRIPLLAHGNSVLLDTRLILSYLESAFPASSHPSPSFSPSPSSNTSPSSSSSSPPSAEARRFESQRRLLEHWIVDAGIFNRAAQLMPATGAIAKDKKFLADRTELTGREWSVASFEIGRPEALGYVRDGFELLEGLLADGRNWVMGTEKPSLGDVEAVWVFDWLVGMEGALPKELISERQFPGVFGYVKRFRAALKAAKSAKPKLCTRISGSDAISHILTSSPISTSAAAEIDASDPLSLKAGERVIIYPIDSGSKHRDTGELVGLTSKEVVLRIKGPEGEVLLRAPRWGYRTVKGGGEGAKL